MGFITDIIKGLPIAAVQEEKIAAFEKKYSQLEAENSELRAENERLKKQAEEEERLHDSVTWRRGRRTGGRWMPFCSSCGKPANGQSMNSVGPYYIYCTAQCGWRVSAKTRIEDIGEVLS